MTRCCYQFRPVGQGCFFTGIYTKKAKQVFNFVYDCGTNSSGSYLDDAIKQFKSDITSAGNKPIIDLLMISHFDDDHVIGVLELLKDVKCRYLVMPFLSVYERLAVFSKGGPKAEWHKSFLRNPQNFINTNDFDVDNIIFIDGNNQYTEETPRTVFPINRDSFSPKSNTTPSTIYGEDDEMKFENKFHYFKMPFELEAQDIGFQFKFYVKPYPEDLISKFHDEIKVKFLGRIISDLFNDYDRLQLKGLYKKIFKDRNKSGLCVAVVKKTSACVHYHDKPNLFFPYLKRQTALMLTGDTSLKTKKNIGVFLEYYKEEMDNVLMFQIPHHGSKYDSRLDIGSGLWNFPMFVINHGSKRTSHPHPDVRSFVITNKKNVWFNTEVSEVKIVYYLYQC